MQKLIPKARFAVWSGLLMLPGLLGCGNSEPPRVMPELPDASAASKAMELYDKNGDGFLDAAELEHAPGLKAAMKALDTQNVGKITQQEIADRIKTWADSRMGRLQVICNVRHNGKPLEGATVAVVPEQFLGSSLPRGSGKTSKAGTAIICSPYGANPAMPGLPPGFYRVEIAKDGDAIPAKYNTQTTLGVEVSSEYDSSATMFNLEY